VIIVAVVGVTGVTDNDSKNRKITMEIVIMIVIDSVYAVNLKIWRKKNFFFS
jgi:hypothetical protein